MPEIRPHEWWPYAFSALRVPIIVVGAWLLTRLVKLLLGQLRQALVRIGLPQLSDHELQKRADTIVGLLYKTSVGVIWTVALMMALKELGFDIGPILAGAGIVGLAVGFGAQNLVRDVIGGLFLIIENQIRVGDVAIINGTTGLVEEVNLRTTLLRGLDGTVHIFPNGSINSLSNMTREHSYYVLDLGVAYKEDTDRVVEVMREVAQRMMGEPEWSPLIKEPLEVLGVDEFADSAVMIKARLKTEPCRQWEVGRELRRRLKRRFDELGIEIPFPQRTLHLAEAGRPIRVELAQPDREELRKLIREVLEETRRPSGKEPS